MSQAKSKIATRADLADLGGLAVLAGLTALFAFGVIVPLTLSRHQQQSLAEESARQRQQASALASTVREAKVELERVRASLTASPLRIELPSALNERLSQLITLAGVHRLALAELKPGEAIAGKRYTITPVRLAGTGTYPDVARFLHRLHQQMPDLALTGFRLERGDAGASRCELEFRWIARPAGDAAGPALAAVEATQP